MALIHPHFTLLFSSSQANKTINAQPDPDSTVKTRDVQENANKKKKNTKKI